MSYPYHQYMNELSDDELFEGLLGYGLFAEKIPPVFTSKPFFDWCDTQKNDNVFKDEYTKSNGNTGYRYEGKDYIRYDNMRNINIPRPLAIPNPIAYRNQCKALSDSWNDLKEHFKTKTEKESHKVSRIHIRKLEKQKHLFEMNYKNFSKDDVDIENELSIGARFVVKADISNCFLSIYTHSIPWALVGKEGAKSDRNENKYFNKLDKFTRNLKFGETHGILIGPHASNLISEIVLVAVDYELNKKGYKYIRHVDDYTCFIDSHEKSEQFLLDLASNLKNYELSLNHKKTEITVLPLASVEHWVNKIGSFCFLHKKDDDGKVYITHKELKSYLDLAIELLHITNNTAVINYAVKVISKNALKKHSLQYYIKRIHHLLLLYPYLVTLLDEFVFKKFDVEISEVKSISDDLFKLGIDKQLYEASSYSLFLALQYDFELNPDRALSEIAKESDDCVFLMLSYLYDKKLGNDVGDYKKLAKDKNENDFDRYWLFIYEVLDAEKLGKPYNSMKEKYISFIKGAFND